MFASGSDIEHIKARAEAGDAQAAFDLGWCYYLGNGVTQDVKEAQNWYAVAVAGGVHEAGEVLSILKTETERALELESLVRKHTEDTHRVQRSKRWIVGVFIIIVVGSIGGIWHVLNRKASVVENAADDPVSHENEPASEASAEQRAPDIEEASAVPQAQREPPVPEYEPLEAKAETRQDVTKTELSQNITTEEVTPLIEGVVDPNVQERSLEGSRASVKTMWDINDVIRMAQEWLEDPMELSDANQPEDGKLDEVEDE